MSHCTACRPRPRESRRSDTARQLLAKTRSEGASPCTFCRQHAGPFSVPPGTFSLCIEQNSFSGSTQPMPVPRPPCSRCRPRHRKGSKAATVRRWRYLSGRRRRLHAAPRWSGHLTRAGRRRQKGVGNNCNQCTVSERCRKDGRLPRAPRAPSKARVCTPFAASFLRAPAPPLYPKRKQAQSTAGTCISCNHKSDRSLYDACSDFS